MPPASQALKRGEMLRESKVLNKAKLRQAKALHEADPVLRKQP